MITRVDRYLINFKTVSDERFWTTYREMSRRLDLETKMFNSERLDNGDSVFIDGLHFQIVYRSMGGVDHV